jgi:hypothetical protein
LLELFDSLSTVCVIANLAHKCHARAKAGKRPGSRSRLAAYGPS